MTTSPNPILAFNCASTFFVDPGTVKNAPEVSVTKIDGYWGEELAIDVAPAVPAVSSSWPNAK